MNQELSRLYQRICDYSLDDGESAFTFTQRLARENGWTLNYARRVAHEYKKFMFLAATVEHPVTPSEQVDQAWHLHLIYTRSYWNDFCGQVLGTQIHHGPTNGGSEEQTKFHNLYERTKASYRHLLNEDPPTDIWPDADRRFGDDVERVRVNTRQHWIVSKQRAQRYVICVFVAIAVVATTAYVARDGGQFVVRSRADSQPLPLATANLTNFLVGGLAIGVVVAVCIGVAACIGIATLFRGKCSACGRTHAMNKTGKTQRGTGWWSCTKDEWKCKYCGATAWTTHYTGCGGGCGTTSGCGGGGSGCGNSGCAGAGCGGGGCGGGGCGGGG